MTFEEMLPDLFELTGPLGARPDVPLEAEDRFTQLVAPFDDRAACREHLGVVLPTMFQTLADRPRWIQGAEWQWFEDRPMVFVGSLDAPPGTFHDDARFYVFWSPGTGVTKCVIQVS